MATLVLSAGVAGADPAEPTNYRSVVTNVEPALPVGVTAEVIGGDGFLDVRSDGHEVVVYDARQPGDDAARPYLRIDGDGTVELNRNAVGYYYNDSRYGSDIPDRVLQPNLPTDWVTVGEDGRYVWHDHRIHWMSPSKPPSVEGSSGRVDLGGPNGSWEVPITVDGEAVTITGYLELLDAPSPLPWLALILVVTVVVVLLGARWATPTMALATLGTSVLAMLAGWETHTAVPPAAGGTPVTWILPLAALAAAAVSVVGLIARRDRASSVAALASACLLAGWVAMRWDVLSNAVLPTALAAPLDRASTALAAGVALGVAVVAVRSGRIATPRPLRVVRPTASPTT